MLPDLALLEIFDFYVYEEHIAAWHTLVHVSRRWRNIVFGSPRRLGLSLCCTASTRVTEMLDVWPPLPIFICDDGHEKYGVDNIIAALEHSDRICQLELFDLPMSQMEKVLPAMQRPLTALTELWLWFEGKPPPVNATSFLGGYTPRLQTLNMDCIPFLGLPNLLLSATNLVHLRLRRIPNAESCSPEAMVSCLSVLTKLEKLAIRFRHPRFRLDSVDWKSRRPPPQTRTLLPVLTELQFSGEGEYLEDLVARIDAPLLNKLDITFQDLIFDNALWQLTQFISRAPKFKAHDEARVIFSDCDVSVILPRTSDEALELAISSRQSYWQFSSLVQVGSKIFPRALLSSVKYLYILEGGLEKHGQDNDESSGWLELVHPFTSVEALYISRRLVPHIVPSLQGTIGETVAGVLPALRNLFLEEPIPLGPIQDAVEQFVAAQQLFGHPIAISHWEREYLKL